MSEFSQGSVTKDPQRPDVDDDISLTELILLVLAQWKLLGMSTSVAALAAFGISSALPKWYTASAVIMPPQQQQSAASAAMAQLGALAGLAGGVANLKSPADQYVALMQSTTVSDRLVDQFKLMDVYQSDFRVDARKKLGENTRINAGKKDGLITITVDDHDPKRAADIANAYIEQLRFVTTQLAVTEAQQRRAFFEEQMRVAKSKLTQAQVALGGAGLSAGILKAEPKLAAESYARLRAEVTGAEVKLQTMRRAMADGSPEVKQQESFLSALRDQVRRVESQQSSESSSSDYISKYRNFKYEEALFDIFAKQYELARVDESREGALIQVVDVATPPERKTGPRRFALTLTGAAVSFLIMSAFFVGRHMARTSQTRRSQAVMAHESATMATENKFEKN